MNISPDVAAKLDIYEQLLKKWQKAINLVGPSTLDNISERHFKDSAQLINFIENKNINLVDIGSGAGFPGMILAIMGVQNVHLVESDARKAVFLQNVSRETNTPVNIHNCRIEDCHIPQIDVLTARALAPLADLLGHMAKLAPSYALFLKGARLEEEISEARKKWNFTAEIHEGMSKILKVKDLKPQT